MKSFNFLILIFYSSVSYGSFVIDPSNITPDSLYNFRTLFNDSKLELAGHKFMEELFALHPEIVKSILGRTERLVNTREYQTNNMEKLEQINLKSLSPNSYIIPADVDGVKFLVEISGQKNRVANFLRQYDFDAAGDIMTRSYFSFGLRGQLTNEEKEKFDAYMGAKIAEGKAKTYQTASRMAMALLIRQYVKKYVNIPKMAIWLLDPAGGVDDSNAVIFESYISGESLEDYLKTKYIPDEALLELCHVIFNAYAWDLKHNTIVSEEDGIPVIYIVDTEQANKMAPSQAFFKNKKDLERNVCYGLGQIFDILKDANRSSVALVAFVTSHPELKNYFGYDDILKKYVELNTEIKS